MGNDLNDLEVMQDVGFPVCPADAHEKIRRLSNHVTKARGGEGVIREFEKSISSYLQIMEFFQHPTIDTFQNGS